MNDINALALQWSGRFFISIHMDDLCGITYKYRDSYE